MNKGSDNNCCKQRFKGVENFFRRIAYNLGNSPSQTDVKIISCIPIDVTDLQQKIIRLQNELENAKKNCAPAVNVAPRCVTPVVFKANGDDDIRLDKPCEEDSFNCKSSMSHDCDHRYNKQQKSSSLVYRSETSQDYRFYSDHRIPMDDKTRAARNQTLRNFFCKKRNRNKKKKGNAQFVYYAQTQEKNPFNVYPESATSKPPTTANDLSVRLNDLADKFSRSFINDMFQKQYRPEPIYKMFSNSSVFSAPVCKDIATDITTTSTNPNIHCNTEICSCCHAPNRDRHINREGYTRPDPINKARYYDSNHYDLVPVRENPSPTKKRVESPKRKKIKRKMVKCCPEEIRPKFVSPMLVDYNYYDHSYRPLRTYTDTYPKHVPVIMRSRRQMVLNEMASRRAPYHPPRPLRIARPSRVCYVDYGPTYTKQLGKELTYNISPNTSTSKNEEPDQATTINMNDSPANEPSAAETITPMDRTEMTLNQIKDILQSVLLEVKTSGKEEKITAPPKKDAFVQNGVSQNNIQGGSQILRSFTYSPYNMNTYSPTCSRQMHSNNFAANSGLPGSPVMQHYPILIQPQRHMCMGWYRHPNTMKCAAATESHRAASAALCVILMKLRPSYFIFLFDRRCQIEAPNPAPTKFFPIVYKL